MPLSLDYLKQPEWPRPYEVDRLIINVFFFFFFVWIYSLRGLCPIIDFTLLGTLSQAPVAFFHSPRVVRSLLCGAPRVLAPHRIQLESSCFTDTLFCLWWRWKRNRVTCRNVALCWCVTVSLPEYFKKGSTCLASSWCLVVCCVWTWCWSGADVASCWWGRSSVGICLCEAGGSRPHFLKRPVLLIKATRCLMRLASFMMLGKWKFCMHHQRYRSCHRETRPHHRWDPTNRMNQ